VTSSSTYTIQSAGGVAGTIDPMEMQRSAGNTDPLKVPINTLLAVFTSLAFDPPSAGDVTALTFTFTPNDEIDVTHPNQGVVTFLLPGFTGGGDAGISLTSSHITMGSPQADGVFTTGSWVREGSASRLRLTVDAANPALFDKEQIVTISTDAGIKLPADGLTSAQSSIKIKVGPDAIVGGYDWTQVTTVPVVTMDAVPQHITGLKVNELEPRGTTALGHAIVPRFSSVKLEFSEEVAGVFATGDRVSLRATASTCYSSRVSTASSDRSPNVALTSFIGTLDASGLTAEPTLYRLCYVGVDLAVLAGVDSETGIIISVQSYVTSIDLLSLDTSFRESPAASIRVSLHTLIAWPLDSCDNATRNT